MIYDIYLTAIGCIPGGSGTPLQTKITYNNNNQHQHYIEQTIYPPLGGGKSADRAPSLSGMVTVPRVLFSLLPQGPNQPV